MGKLRKRPKVVGKAGRSLSRKGMIAAGEFPATKFYSSLDAHVLKKRRASAPENVAKREEYNEGFDAAERFYQITHGNRAIRDKKKGARKSAEVRQSKNTERDRRIHDLHAAGNPQKVIADAVGFSISTVSRTLKNPRP